MKQEGNTIIIPCTFNENKFQINKDWCNFKNELFVIETGRIIVQINVPIISNLTLMISIYVDM